MGKIIGEGVDVGRQNDHKKSTDISRKQSVDAIYLQRNIDHFGDVGDKQDELAIPLWRLTKMHGGLNKLAIE